ncbi:MAG: serine/threonine-protein kinase, partial [Aggregatilineales bacterium]
MSEQKIIGERYELQQEIGMGGMGAVFLGVDTVTQEKVAIKQLKPEVIRGDPDIVERFDREGEMLRKLHHPGIVAVLATVEEDGNHYIVLEYVTGGSLRDLLDKTPRLPYEQVLQIALDLSDALARAHRLKVIHRDIKPANVLIAEDGTPRLTDFGVAHMGDKTRVTATGVVVGTLAYLPPES